MPKAMPGRLAEAPLWEPLLARLQEAGRELPSAPVPAEQLGLAPPQPQANVPQWLNRRPCLHSPVQLELLQPSRKTLRNQRRLNPLTKIRHRPRVRTPIKLTRRSTLRIPLHYSPYVIVE